MESNYSLYESVHYAILNHSFIEINWVTVRKLVEDLYLQNNIYDMHKIIVLGGLNFSGFALRTGNCAGCPIVPLKNFINYFAPDLVCFPYLNNIIFDIILGNSACSCNSYDCEFKIEHVMQYYNSFQTS
jgi:hypothetical protein